MSGIKLTKSAVLNSAFFVENTLPSQPRDIFHPEFVVPIAADTISTASDVTIARIKTTAVA